MIFGFTLRAITIFVHHMNDNFHLAIFGKIAGVGYVDR